jgi:hypothetical protein
LPNVFLGVVSHLTAEPTSPSNRFTASSKIEEMRSNRSDSSGLSRPEALRRARVRMMEASRKAARPLRDSRACSALKENPRSMWRISSAEYSAKFISAKWQIPG